MVKENARTSHHTPVIVSWEGTEGGGTWKGDIFNFVFLVYFRGG